MEKLHSAHDTTKPRVADVVQNNCFHPQHSLSFCDPAETFLDISTELKVLFASQSKLGVTAVIPFNLVA